MHHKTDMKNILAKIRVQQVINRNVMQHSPTTPPNGFHHPTYLIPQTNKQTLHSPITQR